MTEFIARCLVNRGYEPVVAYYEPYSLTPELSVPCYALLRRSVRSKCSTSLGGLETHAIGAWLPELEFTHYLATGVWNGLIESCDYHMAVSGSALALTPFFQKKAIPRLAGDRMGR